MELVPSIDNKNLLDFFITKALENTICSFIVSTSSGVVLLECNEAFLSFIDGCFFVNSNYPVSLEANNISYNVIVCFLYSGVEHKIFGSVGRIDNGMVSISIEITGPYSFNKSQRRLNKRYQIPNNLISYVSLNDNIEELSYLKILDISEGGISCLAKVNYEFYIGKVFHEAIFEINSTYLPVFVTTLELRHFKYNIDISNYVCGLKFNNLSPNASLSIFNFISKLKDLNI